MQKGSTSVQAQISECGAADASAPGRWERALERFAERAEKTHRERMAVLHFDSDDLVWLDGEATESAFSASGRLDPAIEFVMHSHPDGSAWPSERDMRQAWAMGRPWGIAPRGMELFLFGPEVPVSPILNRPFRFGVTDCYSLVRDVLARDGIQIREYPRTWGFWSGTFPKPLYEDHVEREGYRLLEPSEEWHKLEKGDVLLFRLRSRVANHAGVYKGGGLMVHHLGSGAPYDPTRPATVVPLERWRNACCAVCRHD